MRGNALGLTWALVGGQAILTIRAWTQSDRFDRAWGLLENHYHTEVAEFRAAA